MELDCTTLHPLRRDDSAKSLVFPKAEAYRRRSFENTARVANPGTKGATFCGNLLGSPEGRPGVHITAIHVDTTKAVHSIDMMHAEEELRNVRTVIAVLDDLVCKATSSRVHCILILQEANGAATRLEQAYHNKTVNEASFFIDMADKIKAIVERGGVVVSAYGYWDDAEVGAELVEPKLVLAAFNQIISQLKAVMRRRSFGVSSGGKMAGAPLMEELDTAIDCCKVPPILLPLGPYAAFAASLDSCRDTKGSADSFEDHMGMMMMDFTPLDLNPDSPRCLRMVGTMSPFRTNSSASMTSDVSSASGELSEESSGMDYMSVFGAMEMSPADTQLQGVPLQHAGYNWGEVNLKESDVYMEGMEGMLPLPVIDAVSAPRAAKVSHLKTMLDLSLTAVSLLAAVERRDGAGCWEVLVGLQERIARAAA